MIPSQFNNSAIETAAEQYKMTTTAIWGIKFN